MAFANHACPKCGDKVFNNRGDKRNPKAPDEKCANRECDYRKWDTPKGGTPAPTPARSGGVRSGSAPMGPLYNDCLGFAKACCEHHFGKDCATADIVAAAATIFIQLVRDGGTLRPVKAAPPPKPPEPEPSPFPYDGFEGDLPF